MNVIALAANLGFIALHEVQTQLFYDGLAQDVSIFSSQGSVVRPQVPRLPVQLGGHLHLLVPPDGVHQRPPDRLLLPVPARWSRA
ncbi:hypothetical protein ACPZ19_06725 [Amycolatopsis lurida]